MADSQVGIITQKEFDKFFMMIVRRIRRLRPRKNLRSDKDSFYGK